MALTLETLPAEEYAAWREGYLLHRAQGPRMRGVDPDVALERVTAMLAARLGPEGPGETTEVLTVVADGARVGDLVLLWVNSTQAQVGGLRFPAELGPDVCALLLDRVAAAGGRSLGLGVEPREPASVTFVEGRPFELVATQMQLDLTAEPADDRADRVVSRPATPEETAAYFAHAVDEFADELTSADPHLAREDAVAESRRVYEQALPQGADTPDHDFLVAEDAGDGRRVGFIWLFHEGRTGFVYDVVVDEAERGRGYGRAVMDLGAAHCRALGLEVLGLNVFGHNHVAKSLYDALGYATVEEGRQVAVTPR